jgi:hypothetical protein
MPKVWLFCGHPRGTLQKKAWWCVLQALRAGLITESDICGELKDWLASSTPAAGRRSQ